MAERRPEWAFVFSGAGDGLLWGFFLAAIVWWVNDLALSPFRLVLLGTVLLITVLVSEVPTGVVADRFSRKWSVVLGHLILGISLVLSVVSTNYGVLLGAQALAGFGWTFRSGADIAWVTAEAPGVDISRLIVRRHRIHLVSGLAVIVFTMLVGSWSLRGVIAIHGMLMIASSLVLAVSMTDNHRAARHTRDQISSRGILSNGIGAVRQSGSLRRLVLLVFFVGAASEIIDRLGFKRFLDDGDFGDDSLVFTGMLFIALNLGGILVISIVQQLIGRGWTYPALVAAMMFISAVGALVVAIAPVLILAVGLVVQDGNREAIAPVTESWANEIAEETSRATVLSLISQAAVLGEAGGGLLLGFVAQILGLSVALGCSAGLLAVAGLIARSSTSEESATALASTADGN